MAIGHLNVVIVKRAAGQSSVHAAAYAARERLTDERTGTVYDYARKGSDVVTSWIWLPKGAPAHLRNRAALWNGIETAETRKNSQLARRIILALPHELTPEQQQMTLKDFVRENFTRKGLAADVSIHKPHAFGDQRNDHAHILIPTRFLDKDGIGKKDRESNSKETLQLWRDNWERLVNRQLERYGHETRISMKSLEAQGIDRTPQIHLGQGATALLRKGIDTERAGLLREIANDNARPDVAPELTQPAISQPETGDQAAPRREAVNDNIRPAAEPETIDRDAQDAEWQDSVNAAGIAYEAEQRRQFLASQAVARETMERHGQAMAARHTAALSAVIERYSGSAAPTALQPETGAEMEQAVTGGLSFFLSIFASIAESVTNTGRRIRGTAKAEKKEKREEQRRTERQREQLARELEAIHAEQARERAVFERRRADLLDDQSRARRHYEQQVAENSSLTHEFYVHGSYIEAHRSSLMEAAARKEARQERDRGGPDLAP